MLAKDVAERKIDISSKEYSRRITEIAELSQERTIKETMNNHWISYKVVDWTQGVPSINYGPDTAEVLSRNLQKDWKPTSLNKEYGPKKFATYKEEGMKGKVLAIRYGSPQVMLSGWWR
eukprot:GHVU01034128.1.p1 GENE.GHVU01034128.1~~GHVU01034128.1.p1  ORF type:complete len:119 (-),score=14.72 GHVU01034128.1:22-378(-)